MRAEAGRGPEREPGIAALESVDPCGQGPGAAEGLRGAGQRSSGVFVLLQLPPDRAERLLQAVGQGELDRFEVIDARPVEPEGAPPAAEMGHLVLTRRTGQSVVIGRVTVTVLAAQRGRIRLGIRAPRAIPVGRPEVRAAVQLPGLE